MLFEFRLANVQSGVRRVGSVGTWRHVVGLLVSVIMLAFFIWRAMRTRKPGWLVFAVFFALLTLAFGPYARWIKKRYRLALDERGTIHVHSVINAIPRSFAIDCARVTTIVRADLRKEQALHFLAGDELLGKFNDRSVPKAQLAEFYRVLRAQFPHIDVPEGGPTSPNLPLFGVD